MDNYSLTEDDNDFVKCKDLYREYTESAFFCNLSKAEKRLMNKKNFTEMIKTHLVFKGRFKDNNAKINGKVVNCERIHNLKKKEDDVDSDDEGV